MFQSLKRDNERSDSDKDVDMLLSVMGFNPSSGITSVLTNTVVMGPVRAEKFQSLKRDNERSDWMPPPPLTNLLLFQSLKRDNERSDCEALAREGI